MIIEAKKLQQLIKKGQITITPFDQENLKSVGYTFSLYEVLRKPISKKKVLDLRKKLTFKEFKIPKTGYVLKPGEFVLGRTIETLNLKNSYCCILSTRSGIAQAGVDVLLSSSIAEPDTNNPFTLEIKNNGTTSVLLSPGLKIVKGIFVATR